MNKHDCREVENKLDDDIEEPETMLDRERIETEKAYDDCSTILKEFDRGNCQFSKDVEILLNVYANASKNVTISNSECMIQAILLSIKYSIYLCLFILFTFPFSKAMQFCGHKCLWIYSSSK